MEENKPRLKLGIQIPVPKPPTRWQATLDFLETILLLISEDWLGFLNFFFLVSAWVCIILKINLWSIILLAICLIMCLIRAFLERDMEILEDKIQPVIITIVLLALQALLYA